MAATGAAATTAAMAAMEREVVVTEGEVEVARETEAETERTLPRAAW